MFFSWRLRWICCIACAKEITRRKSPQYHCEGFFRHNEIEVPISITNFFEDKPLCGTIFGFVHVMLLFDGINLVVDAILDVLHVA